MENGRIQNQMGLVAYNFEPELTVQELEDRNRAALASSEAVVQTLDEWYECGNCQEMPSLEENVCCRVSDLVLPSLKDHNCITMHHSYDTLILNSDVLALAYIQMMMYKGQQGRAPEELSNRQSRLVAYRQFICWMLKGEKLGKGRRVVIPSCVVKDIRDSFPENNNDYTGFQAAIDVRELFC
ncbi:P2X purinoceptor 7-like [Mytilus galloprovincialis]|uniref:P2X purinoceptor 7-like n=1 Tax=Mytilus galloprovincialis TaxID=29158 RepID=UPI003F7BB052